MRPLVAIGDPQAPLSRVKDILHRHALLEGDKLTSKARLLSIGDHFDWGGNSAQERRDAADDGEAFLRFLASQGDSAVILAGNHDLARVGELLDVNDATFASWQAKADLHYYGASHAADEHAFFTKATNLPSTEIVARDLSTFRASQQVLVEHLLTSKRMRLAHAEDGLLYTHAGITRRALWRIGLDESDTADDIATALNARLDDAVRACLLDKRRPLVIEGIHRPGDGIGEGDGVLYHRPVYVEKDQWIEPRRFDPRTLPRGLWQVVGHVRDKRCLSALGPWAEQRAEAVGKIRHLISHDGVVRYRVGPPPPRATVNKDAAVMIFIDGAMNICEPEHYQLLDSRSASVAA